MRYTALLLALLAGLSCARVVMPEGAPEVYYPDGRTVLQPPPTRYHALYHEVASCVGLTPSYPLVVWFSAPRILYLVPVEGRVHRVSLKGVQSGYQITLRREYLSDPDVVRHESLHQLLVANLEANGHPSPPFGVCAPLGFSSPDPALPGWEYQ